MARNAKLFEDIDAAGEEFRRRNNRFPSRDECLASIAISLKRIADVLETQEEDRQVDRQTAVDDGVIPSPTYRNLK